MAPAGRERAENMRGLVWLASYPKSGNTWVRAFLHNLLRPGPAAHDINDMNRLSTTDVAPEWYEKALGKPIAAMSAVEIAQARPLVHKLIHDTAEGLILVKSHSVLGEHLGTPTVSPRHTLAAVYLVRNPLDVAISYAHHLGVTIDAAIAIMAEEDRMVPAHARGVAQPIGSWSQNVASWTAHPHAGLLTLRYEDLLAKPDQAFAKLAAFLRADDPRLLPRAIEQSSFGELQKQEARAGYHERPQSAQIFFRQGISGQWRTELSAAQIGGMIERHKVQMAKFGYLAEAERFLKQRSAP